MQVALAGCNRRFPRPHFCLVEITQDVREYAAQKEIDEQAALGVGMREKAEEFVARGERFTPKHNRNRIRATCHVR